MTNHSLNCSKKDCSSSSFFSSNLTTFTSFSTFESHFDLPILSNALTASQPEWCSAMVDPQLTLIATLIVPSNPFQQGGTRVSTKN